VKGNEEENKVITDDNVGEDDGKDEFGKETGSTVGVKGKGKKRKRTKIEVMEGIMTKAMKTMTNGLKESEKMFVDLEEKYMKFEEKYMKFEEKYMKFEEKNKTERPRPSNKNDEAVGESPNQYAMYQTYSSQPGYFNCNDRV